MPDLKGEVGVTPWGLGVHLGRVDRASQSASSWYDRNLVVASATSSWLYIPPTWSSWIFLSNLWPYLKKYLLTKFYEIQPEFIARNLNFPQSFTTPERFYWILHLLTQILPKIPCNLSQIFKKVKKETHKTWRLWIDFFQFVTIFLRFLVKFTKKNQ